MATPLPSQTATAPSAQAPEARRVTVRRLGVLSLAKVQAVLFGGVGLVLALVFVASALVIAAAGDGPRPGVTEVGLVIAFPLLYGALGFASGLVTAGLYNALAARIGGVEMEIA